MQSPQTIRLFIFLLLCGTIVLGLDACKKAPKFSDTPNIQYKNIYKQPYCDYNRQKEADSVVIGLHFEDGNGDLGYPQDEQNESNIDFFIDVYRETGGVFSPVIFADSFSYNGHMPLLAPVSSTGPIEGDLYFTITFPYADTQADDDTLKFVVKIEDRKGNVSNTVETDPVIVRKTPNPLNCIF